jgi:quinol monooxygenase YgiN
MVRSPIRMSVQLAVRPEQANLVSSALNSVMIATRREPGCVSCSLATELHEHVTLRLVEEWATQDALDRYIRSERFVTLASLMESATEEPLVEFTLPREVRGLDYAHEVRDSVAHRVPRHP